MNSCRGSSLEYGWDEMEQTDSRFVKASCLAKQTAIIKICSTAQKEKKKDLSFHQADLQARTAIVWQLYSCICFVNSGRRRWACFLVYRGGKKPKHLRAHGRREKTATGRSWESTWPLCSLKWNLVLFAQSIRVGSSAPSVCSDPSSLSLITVLPVYFLFLLLSDRRNNECCSVQQEGHYWDPTVNKGWKLSLLHLCYSLASFPVGWRIFVWIFPLVICTCVTCDIKSSKLGNGWVGTNLTFDHKGQGVI